MEAIVTCEDKVNPLPVAIADVWFASAVTSYVVNRFSTAIKTGFAASAASLASLSTVVVSIVVLFSTDTITAASTTSTASSITNASSGLYPPSATASETWVSIMLAISVAFLAAGVKLLFASFAAAVTIAAIPDVVLLSATSATAFAKDSYISFIASFTLTVLSFVTVAVAITLTIRCTVIAAWITSG